MEAYRPLLEQFVKACRETLDGENLTGVYLHGSAAMGCFTPQSDLDLLVVTRKGVSQEAGLAFMERVVSLDARGPGKGLELSVVQRSVLNPFVYPTPFELHFSRTHLERYRQNPAEYVRSMRGTDPDLAAHCVITRARGAALWGEPIASVFAPVPREAYLDSILRDVADAEEAIASNPVYVALNLCRVLAFVREGLVLSKREGGEWGCAHLPGELVPFARAALAAYSAGEKWPGAQGREGTRFARRLLGFIRDEGGVKP